ncbi:unnamed protein product (macronuclear) [Paramecium tetraurelia]|uniref:Uncharacterized protein n=1 Tax=Paramecium tetraurelia TaxID=5888 RepID=A0DEX6_PARTE|nr:uncharacterized protein GSPATT00016419001 [Paramecium tetraurelia]CAK81593.1 unnamed protein product [Paramecium tetraurelia]|eukprot:XP_001448990.1 hypothetical protein (macronuclear) [Paramecium tetraurelia strain d4-2]
MYKLNIFAAKQFFDLQTPVNFLAKKKNFANVREIRQNNKIELGLKLGSHSLPHNTWINTPLTTNRIIKPQGSLALHQKFNKLPIYMARKDMIKELEKFKQRACSTSPSKKQKKYHNLNCNNFERNEKLKKYFQTQSQNSPQKLNSLSYFEDSRQQIFSSQKFHENNFQRLNSVKPTIQPKFPQLKKNQKTESNEIDRQNSELMNTSINQNFQECSSPKRDRIQNQKYYQPNKCTLQRNKFLNDSYRLYGFVTEIKDQKQKYSTLHVSNFINLNKSSEQNNNANSSKSRELTPQDKTMKKSRSSKDKLQNLLKQSHLKHLERHFRIPAKKHKSPKKQEEYDRNLVLSYFPKQDLEQILKKKQQFV